MDTGMVTGLYKAFSSITAMILVAQNYLKKWLFSWKTYSYKSPSSKVIII